MMATTNTSTETLPIPAKGNGGLLVLVPDLAPPQVEILFNTLETALPNSELLIAAPDGAQINGNTKYRVIPIPAAAPRWTLVAADFVNAQQIAAQNSCQSALILGPDCDSLTASSLRDLAQAVTVGSIDLAVPCYALPARAGLLNSAILYPLNRALFATRVRYPLAVDVAVSHRMLERLSLVAQRSTGVNQGESPLWPVSEARMAGMLIEETDVGERKLPQPADPDLNTILPFVTGSFFSDIDAKAAFWQRARVSPPARNRVRADRTPDADSSAEIAAMIQAFRLAYTNLRDIWGIVLPPNTLIGLKRLSQLEGQSFRMPANLWVRIVFDFLVAYRLRSINRGHLLGALIPLYLAWAASHINGIAAGADAEGEIEALAATFEADKAYLLARWRWPDRFNP